MARVSFKLYMMSRFEIKHKLAWFRRPHELFYILIVAFSALNFASESEVGELKMEEIIVEGEVYTIETYDGFVNLTESNRKGARLYKEKRYREAIPYLLTGARAGFKMSQARLGAIYLYGLGSVDRNLEQGFGWLGVASESPTSPTIKNRWRNLVKEVPEERTRWLEEIVMEYRRKYGTNATGTECEMTPSTRSLISRLECTLSDEWQRFASDDIKVMVGCILTPSGDDIDIIGPECAYHPSDAGSSPYSPF